MGAPKSKPLRATHRLFVYALTLATCILFCAAVVSFYWELTRPAPILISKLSNSISENLMSPMIPVPIPTPTGVPYPPKDWHCVKVPILMYHHVEPMSLATKAGHAPLTVDSSIFASQMQYLASHDYSVITLQTLSDFFDGKATLPAKPVVLTFDDGYSDFYAHALPVLESHGYKSDLFVPTGLMENPGYMNWGEIQTASTRGVSIDHHTWSHAKMMRTDTDFFHREIDIASQQLTERGYGPVRIFAYPYGSHSKRDLEELSARGFTLAVTTIQGQVQCKEDRLALRRTRIGNQSLKVYGL